MNRLRTALLAGATLLLAAASTQAQVTLTVSNSTAPWLGFMNVYNLPSAGGAFQFPSGWGVADLSATFNDGAGTLTLTPNSIGDPNSYWYTPSGGPGSTGNKIMEAALYRQFTGVYHGQNVTFQGTVLSNTFTSAHSTIAFIRDFAPDFSSFNTSTVLLSEAGAFSISLNTINDPARHVQVGFVTTGVNVWVTDLAPYGSLVVSTIPEPGVYAAMLSLGALALVAVRRRRR